MSYFLIFKCVIPVVLYAIIRIGRVSKTQLENILFWVNNYPTSCKNMHFIYICKLLYIFLIFC